ncbi:putative secreted alkaline phosphatase [Parafrankia sp. Ea1.12]|uniref:alkaline phosphatase D family protein n=1 Tax=Parafrankia sp. Ea1.12 TaxID=573499 RepID=UPI000DA4B797|nr:alkaline phosphatase D family protein [Parafrankia sp. Ea1.12]SQD99027.1 putative secreted alkaline phosphatase [Parafrankia sp. Ea1.12]
MTAPDHRSTSPLENGPAELGPAGVGRRALLRGGAVVATAGVVGLGSGAGRAGAATGAPAVAAGGPGQVLGGRPAFTSGVQAGDVDTSGAVIWARSDRPALMTVEVSGSESFRSARTVGVTRLTDATDRTGVVAVNGLPPGGEVFYRVRLAAADDPRRVGETLVGRLRTAPVRPRDVSLVWSGDVCGQGWGINPDRGGMTIFETMRRLSPDFAICSGDFVYADGPLAETVALPDGSVWRNLVTDEKRKVAETLAEFRGNFRYNFMDANLLAFNREVPWVFQWDDHETTNNWYPGEILTDDRYTEKRVDVLSARSRQALFEYTPTLPGRPDPAGRLYRKISYGPLLDVFVLDMRSYKNNNGVGQTDPAGAAILGTRQRDWLIDGLTRSRATWKVIANDLPLGIVVPDGTTAIEGVAQGSPGVPLGREVEIGQVLSAIRRNRVRNTVWITADVHYTAALSYHPDRAATRDFDPFWEFVAGPLNAGTFGPNALDPTFGPEQVFARTPPPGQSNLPPSAGLQFFGRLAIDGGSRALTVELRDAAGGVLWSKALPAG